MYLMREQTSMRALSPSGKPPTTRAPPDLPVGPFDHVVRADAPAAPRGIPGQQVGRRLPDALPETVGRRLEPPAFHLRGDRLGLGEGGFPGFHGEHGLERRGHPFAVAWRRLREHVAHEMHHAALVLRLGQHRADRGHQSGAPVADHEPDALQTAFDHAPDELLPTGPVLPPALRHANHLAVDAADPQGMGVRRYLDMSQLDDNLAGAN